MEDEKVKELANRFVDELSQKGTPLFTVRAPGVKLFEKELERLRSRKDEIEELLQYYFDAIKEVKAKKFTPKEKLKKLLSPLISLHEIYFPNYLAYHKFIDNGDIDIKNEVYSKDITHNSKKYTIRPIKVGDLDFLETRGHNIHISDEYLWYLHYCRDVKIISESEFKTIYKDNKEYTKPKTITTVKVGNQEWEWDGTNKKWINTNGVEADETTKRKIDFHMAMLEPPESRKSLADIYELWLPTLTEEKIKSNDLLDQILVSYTVKNALNGERKAVDKLGELYRNTAIGIAVNMAKKRALLKYADDIKQEANIVLRLILSGFSPKSIMDSLKSDVNDFIPIPKSYINYYNLLYSEYVPAIITSNFKKQIVELILSGDYILSDTYSLLTPYSTIRSYTRWMKPNGKRINMFNSYSFRPNNNTNLTTWLFGVKGDPKKGTYSGAMQGKFCQYINDYVLKRYDKIRNAINTDCLDEKESIDFPDNLNLKTGFVCKQCKQNVLAFREPKACEEHENPNMPSQIKEKKSRQASIINDFEMKKAKNEMIKSGIFKRNVEKSIDIVLQKMQGFSYSEIEKTSGISRRQVINICNKVKKS